jgi:putative DNA primase/helicase
MAPQEEMRKVSQDLASTRELAIPAAIVDPSVERNGAASSIIPVDSHLSTRSASVDGPHRVGKDHGSQLAASTGDLQTNAVVESESLDQLRDFPKTLEYLSPQELRDYIAKWLGILTGGHAVELRALEVSNGYGQPHTENGFYDTEHLSHMAYDALDLGRGAKGVYFTLNPINNDLLARCFTRCQRTTKGSGATDNDVVGRRFLLVDADPDRIEGVSSTDEEKDAAWHKVLAVRQHLLGLGWPQPYIADSGNGYHLLYRIDLPAEDDGLVQRVLQALARRFDDDHVKIDQKVFNPARICKLYGTKARKGDDVPRRPHRWTALLQLGDETPVSQTLLENLAAEAPLSQKVSHGSVEKFRTGDQPSTAHLGASPDRKAVLERAAAYLRKVPGAISGNGGHNQTFKAACKLVRGFDLSIGESLPLLLEWNNTCEPPWAEHELLHKLEDADKQEGQRGYFLADAQTGGDDADALGTKDDPENGTSNLADDDPSRLAQLYLDRHWRDPRGQSLRYWKEQWYVWQDGAYRVLEDVDLKAKLWTHCEGEYQRINKEAVAKRIRLRAAGHKPEGPCPKARKVKRDQVYNVIAALESRCIVPSEVAAPAWLGETRPFPAGELLVAQNGIVHVPSYIGEKRDFLPLTPELFNCSALTLAIDPSAPQPRKWLRFLAQLWPGDWESIHTLQEWFGYTLLPDTSQQKILLIVGPKRSGKGTIARILRELLGEQNVAGPTLSDLASRFGLWTLIGKPLAIIADARLSGRVDQGAVLERLLAISGEDALDIDRKNRQQVTMKLPTRFMILTNELPKIVDASGALASRFVPLRLTQSWFDKEKPRLIESLRLELPGILNWAVDGLKRLKARGHFVRPAAAAEDLAELSELSSPIRAFVNEECVLGSAERVVKGDLYGAWKQWAEEHGYSVGNEGVFGRNLRAAFTEITTSGREGSGSRSWLYGGIALKDKSSGLLVGRLPSVGLSSKLDSLRRQYRARQGQGSAHG